MPQNKVNTRATYKREAKIKNKFVPHHIRNKHRVKQELLKAHGPNFKKENPEQWRELEKIAMKAVRKEKLRREKDRVMKIFDKVELETPLRPSKLVFSLDIQSLELFVQAMAWWLSMNTALFAAGTGIEPWQFRFYCYALVFAYLRKVGKLTGSLEPNVPQLNESFQLPRPLAKWMEYIAPFYHLGSCQTTEFAYNQEFVANYNFIGDTDGFRYGGNDFDYTGFPHMIVAHQKTIPQATAVLPTVPYDQTYYPFQQTNGNSGIALSDWMTATGNMTLVSAALETNRVPTENLAWLPGMSDGKDARAPDGSAYCVKAGDILPLTTANNTVAVNGAVLNIHNEFDVELSYLFSLYRANVTTPAICSKPLALSLYDYNFSYGTDRPFPWYAQVFSSFVFLAFKTTGPFKRGHAKHVFNIEGARVSSFFPNPRNISTAAFSALIVQAYQNIQTLQSEAGGKMVTQAMSSGPAPVNVQQGGFAQEYKNGQNLWTLLTSSFTAFQRRFNEQCMIYVNSPQFNNSGANVIMPQCFYVDSTALDVALPPLISEAIDAIGVVIDNKGVMQVPVTVYGNNQAGALPYPLTSANDIGPVAWSGYGFTPQDKQTYPNANITTLAIAPTPSTANVPVNVALDGLIVNSTMAGTYQGFDASANQYGTLYSFYLNGQWLQKIHKLFQSWVQTGNFVNTIYKTFIRPRNPPMGKAYVMLTEVVLNWQAAQIEPVVPNNLAIVMSTSGGPTQTSTLSVYKIPVVSLTSSIYLTKARAFLAKAFGWVQTLDQQLSQGATITAGKLLTLNLVLFNAFTSAPAPAVTNSAPAGLLSVTTQAANSVSTAVQDLTQALQAPDSEFSEEKKKIDHAKTSIKSLVPKNLKDKIGKLTYTRALESTASSIAHNLYGHTHMQPGVTPRTLGRVGKGVSPNAANVLAVTESTAGVSSDENVAVENKYTPKMMMLKCDGHRIKKVGKALESATKTVASGLNSAVKIAGDVTTIASTASSILGGI